MGVFLKRCHTSEVQRFHTKRSKIFEPIISGSRPAQVTQEKRLTGTSMLQPLLKRTETCLVITTQILNYNTKSLDINVIKTITTTLAEAKLNIIEASETF